MRRIVLQATLLSLAFPGMAQNTLRIGEWRAHLPYSSGITVTQDAEKVYYGSDNALFSVEKESNTIEFFSKIDGLSDVGINLVKYHEFSGALIVVYQNSNIDLVFPDGIMNIDDILRNNTIVGSKQVNNVYADNSSVIYLACDFGLVELDVITGKFGFTMFTEVQINDFTKFDEAFWIATKEGIYLFDKFGSELVANFGEWELQTDQLGLPDNYSSVAIAVYLGQLYAAIGPDLMVLDQDEFLFWDARDGHVINFISSEGAHLKVGYRCTDNSCNGKIHFFNGEGKIAEHGFACAGKPTYAIEDEAGRVWYADENDGVRVAQNYQWGCENIRFNTPFSANVSELAVRDNTIYLAAGGVSDTYNNLQRADGFAILEGEDWTFFNRSNNEQLSDYDPLDYFRIAPHPSVDTPYVFIGTYYAGLLRYHLQDSAFTFYDKSNSALQGAVGDEQRERVSGMAFDQDNNLWMSNYLAPRPIVVMKADGTWRNFSTPGNTSLGDLVVDQRGFKWCAIISGSAGILVFDDNGTIDNDTDDRYQVFTSSNSNLPTNTLTNLAVDKRGDIWVGTGKGPVRFSGGMDPFEGGNDQGHRIRVEQNGILAYLLGEEEVTSIAIDGANQKWLGTRNGVFVQSPDGETEIAVYNADNSPLLDNTILDIAINPFDGEVFIGTLSGVVSLRAEAIEGRAFHSENAFAYPNPVRPDYNGPIAIKGLASDAAVKITNVAGTVVYETRALGGQAIWNGHDLDGQRASSGVYLVFSTTEDTFDKPDALVTKILLVN